MADTPNTGSPVPLSPQEQRAHDFLHQGRFRKARDEFKELCKKDRAKYLPWLVKANIGLAREMAGKGMLDEARQVLAYLKSIALPADLQLLEVELSKDAKNAPAATSDLLAILADSAGMVDAERLKLADRVVVSFAAPQERTAPAEQKLAGELASIHAALKHISENQTATALDTVRPLPHNSVFNHWKLFIKALAAFHGGEREKSLRFFSELPKGTALEKAGRPYLLLLGNIPVTDDQPVPDECTLEIACRLAGQPGLGHLLELAEKAWRKTDPALVYERLRNAFPRFPSRNLSLLGELSAFSLNCISILPSDKRRPFANFLEDWESDRAARNSIESAMLCRILALYWHECSDPDAPSHFMGKHLNALKILDGNNPKLESVAYGWLGGGYMVNNPDRFLDCDGIRQNGTKLAREMLEKSLQLNPRYLPAALGLCDVYEKLKQNKERNRLLDRMTADFADQKAVLVLAGNNCVERKAYGKGIDYLKRASELDRLDPSIPESLVLAHMQQACHYYKQKSFEKAQESVADAVRLQIESPGNHVRSRWCLQIRHGILELNHGDTAKGSAMLEHAQMLNASPAACQLYAHYCHRAYVNINMRFTSHLDAFKKGIKKNATLGEAIVLVQILSDWFDELDLEDPFEDTDLMGDYLDAAVKRPFTRDQARQFVEAVQTDKDMSYLAYDIVERQLRKDRKDPLFRYYQITDPDSPRPPSSMMRELESIVEEALRRKDEQTARLARQRLETLKITPRSMPPPFPDPGNDEFDPDEDDFDYDDPGGFPPVNPFMPPNASEEKMFKDLANLFRFMSPKKLDKLMNNPPPGVSRAQFKMLVDSLKAAQNGGHPPKPVFSSPPLKPSPLLPTPPTPTPKPQKNPEMISDPNQLDLF